MNTSLISQLAQATLGVAVLVVGTVLLPISAPAFLLAEKLRMRRLAGMLLTLYIAPGAGFGLVVLSLREFQASRV